jgi:hypothetical protein
MIQEEAKANSQDKLKAIEVFLKQMQVEVSAEQLITKDGFIKNIVFYNDIERYVIDSPKKNEEILKKVSEEATGIRKEDTPPSV